MQLKRISVDALQPGMFVHDLECSWMQHPFMRNRFRIDNLDMIQRIRAAGIVQCVIRAEAGDVVPVEPAAADEPAEAAVATDADAPGVVLIDDVVLPPSQGDPQTDAAGVVRQLSKGRDPARMSAAAPAVVHGDAGHSGAAYRAARALQAEAYETVRSVMQEVRVGRPVDTAAAQPVVLKITDSIFANPGALLGMSLLKEKDQYTFLHSVAVCTMLVNFARVLGKPAELVQQIGLGGLLHDVGKMRVPDAVLNKPGRLSPEEYALIKRHPSDGHEILSRAEGVSEVQLRITLEHHERLNGTGYPHRLPAAGISEVGRMAAIVDVYDAISSDRCYHQAMTPAVALGKLVEWSGSHFEKSLVHAFITSIGIFPNASVVLLKSGRVGVVVAQNPHALNAPVVKVVRDVAKGQVQPHVVDLSRPDGHGGADAVQRIETPDRWGIDTLAVLTSD